MNTEQSYPPMMPQAPQPVFATQVPVLYTTPSLPKNEKLKGQKIRIAFLATVMFVVFSYIGTYRAVSMFYTALTQQSSNMLDDNGSPTVKGIVLHSCIFFIGVMILLSKYG